MRLRAWLTENDVDPDNFAERVGVRPKTLYRYLDPDKPYYRIPAPDVMPRITSETRGAVTANDFYAPYGKGSGAA